MKLSHLCAAAIAATGLCLAVLPGGAQTTPTATPAQPQTTPQDQPKGQVIFSRSTDENGQTTTTAQPNAHPTIDSAGAPSIQDAERQAVTFIALDLDVHLQPANQQIAVRAHITVRNDGKAPLTRIPLQISSSLNWESIRVIGPKREGKEIAFSVTTLNSDADHTGQLHEACVSLAVPLTNGQTLQLDVTYSGTIPANAQRLLAIGAPAKVALHSDWDQISVDFTGLRGFGNVVWYPVSSVPVILGDGARLFDEMGEHKLRLSGAHFHLGLTVEFPQGQTPTVALVNGQSVSLAVTVPSGALDQSQEVSGVATADSGTSTLNFEAPSLFVAIRTPHPGPNLTAWTLPDDNLSVNAWIIAATAVTPFLEGWLGHQPRTQLTLLDLPDPQDAPFETGALLATPLPEPTSSKTNSERTTPETLTGVLVHALTHAWLSPTSSPTSLTSPPPPAWLNEGAAAFMGSLWVEKQHGRDQALGTLEAGRAALALVEPASPGASPGQPMARAISPVYYRTKAAYVFWMLRDLAGDQALSAALRASDTAQTNSTARSPFEKLLEQPGAASDLSWFFADWVDADKGLPDLSIENIFPTAVSNGNWLVAVKIANSGYAAAEVPVIVRSGSDSGTRTVTQRLRIPARGNLTARILILGKPTEVQVNDGSVPETQASLHITKLDEPAGSSSSSSQVGSPQR